MGCRSNSNLFLKPNSPVLSGENITWVQYSYYRLQRDISKPKMEGMHFCCHIYDLPAAYQFGTSLKII